MPPAPYSHATPGARRGQGAGLTVGRAAIWLFTLEEVKRRFLFISPTLEVIRGWAMRVSAA